MFDYLNKFKKLPQELQEAASSPAATKIVAELEVKYGIDLAADAIKIMVKEIPWDGLEDYLRREHNLTEQRARELKQELLSKIFFQVTRYLGIQKPAAIAPPPPAVSRPAPAPMPKTNKPAFVPHASKLRPGKPTRDPAGQAVAELMLEALRAADIKAVETDKADRLKSILKTFFNGIRESIQVGDALRKEWSYGGLNLDEATADKVIKLAQRKKGEWEKNMPPIGKKPDDSLIKSIDEIRDVNYDFKALEKAAAKPIISPEKIQQAELKMEKKKNIEQDVENYLSEKKQTPSAAALKNKLPVKVQRAVLADGQGKARMNDIIKPPAKLQGPLEELAELDLVNFRRLAGLPAEAAKKIKAKIDLLEAESFTKRQQAISAWQKSAVYKNYLEIGEQSLNKGMTAADAIAEMEKKNKPVLSIDEFNAILELNKMLRV